MKIATRGSKLALWQAHHVRDFVRAQRPGEEVELVIIKTSGDKILDVPLAEVGGKGLFVKEIEEALLDGRADLAVHSMKDVPSDLAPGLVLGAIGPREDPRDALVLPAGKAGGSLDALPRGANVGTSSLRRMCQLRALRPDLRITPLRGNVDTRLRKLDAGELDAIILAAAGLVRLGLGDRITARLAEHVSLPAVGQGALGLEHRAGDANAEAVARAFADADTSLAVRAERAFARTLEGGCQAPMAAWARRAGDALAIDALVGSRDGQRVVRAARKGPSSDPEALGKAVAEELLAQGAAEILEQERAAAPKVVGGP